MARTAHIMVALLAVLLAINLTSALTIHVEPIRDVIQGEAIYYPVDLINEENNPITVTLGLEGLSDWAIYRVDPYNTVTVDAQSTKRVFVYLRADKYASPGTKDFYITAEYNGQLQKAPLRIAILHPEEGTPTNQWDLKTPYAIGIIVVVVLIILAIILNSERNRRYDYE